MSRRLAVVVGDDRHDPLIAPVLGELEAAGIDTVHVQPKTLALRRLHVDAGHALLDGRRIDAVVFRAAPTAGFADGFSDADSDFASAEVRASWLHVMSLPSVCAVNRGDCDVWFVSSEWSVWRHRLKGAGVPVVGLAVGEVADNAQEHWIQWGGGIGAAPDPLAARCFAAATVRGPLRDPALWCAGAIVDGSAPTPLQRIASVLVQNGVTLAGIDVDAKGRVISVTTVPQISAGIAPEIARRLGGYIHDDLVGRGP